MKNHIFCLLGITFSVLLIGKLGHCDEPQLVSGSYCENARLDFASNDKTGTITFPAHQVGSCYIFFSEDAWKKNGVNATPRCQVEIIGAGSFPIVTPPPTSTQYTIILNQDHADDVALKYTCALPEVN